MKRWIATSLGLILTMGAMAGCKQQYFLAKADLDNATRLIPARADEDPTIGVTPITSFSPAPPTVDSPARPPRYMSLQEAIALALESGTGSSRSGPLGPSQGGQTAQGSVDDSLITYSGGTQVLTNGASDHIRVLALNPAIQQARLEETLARFDTVFASGINWSGTDELQQGSSAFTNGNRATLFSGFAKPLASGGVAGVTFQTDYNYLNNPPFGVINPQYTSRVIFSVEQPLLQNFGVTANQILDRFPTANGGSLPTGLASALNARGAASTGTEGILLARTHFDMQRADFETQVNSLVMNVEDAYWNLYNAYGNLYTNEEVLRIAHKSWTINQAKFQAGTIGPANFFPIRGIYEQFRGERLSSLGQVLEAERNLRGMLGLPIEDGTRLVPVTPPTLAPYAPNWESALNDCLTQRPELEIARKNVRVAQLRLESQRNFLKPDLRLVAQYEPVGFGTRLDGQGTFSDNNGNPTSSNALRSLAGDHFNDFNVGLNFSMPLGYRLENAAFRDARLTLAQSYFVLKDQEERAKRLLTRSYQLLTENYRLIETRRSERIAYAESVEARFREFAAGKTTVADYLVDAQQRLATAQLQEYAAIAAYNQSLARFELSKGNLLKFNNIVIAEGALPQMAAVRAVDHEHQRAEATVLREKALPLMQPGRLAATGDLPVVLDPSARPTEQELEKALDPQVIEAAPMPGADTTTKTQIWPEQKDTVPMFKTPSKSNAAPVAPANLPLAAPLIGSGEASAPPAVSTPPNLPPALVLPAPAVTPATITGPDFGSAPLPSEPAGTPQVISHLGAPIR